MHPENQPTLPFLKAVLDVQNEHPRAGHFRVRGIVAQRTGHAPSEATIGRAMAISRAHHGAPPAWSTDRTGDGPLADEGKYLLYEPTYRHRFWFVDFRYLVRVGEDQHWVYSRKILAGMACEHQDVVAVLSDTGLYRRVMLVCYCFSTLWSSALRRDPAMEWRRAVELRGDNG